MLKAEKKMDLSKMLELPEHIQIDTINSKLPNLQGKAKVLYSEVHVYMDNVYKLTSKNEQIELVDRCLKSQNEIVRVEKKIRDLRQKEIEPLCDELERKTDEFEKTLIAIEIIAQIMQIHERLQKINMLQTEKLYVDAINEIIDLQNMIKSLPEDEKIEPVIELSYNVSKQLQLVLDTLKDVCAENFVYESDTVNNPTLTIKIKKDSIFSDALMALSIYKPNVLVLDNFVRFLMMDFFSTTINFKSDLKREQTEDGYMILKLEVVNTAEKDTYKKVFENLTVVIEYLQEYFNYQLKDSETTLTYIGRDIRDNLSELLIKNCLSDTIPSTTEGLKKYNEVIKDTEVMQKKLQVAGIFSDDMVSLIEYANNVDILFINKKCKDYRDYARGLMKKDLHDTTEVGAPHDPNTFLKEDLSDEFPFSAISTSVKDLLKLGTEIMDKATSGPEVSSGRLYCTAINIFESYGKEVLEIHKKFLHTIPQQIAIFYNNCMYLAYNLDTWEVTYKNKLPSTLTMGPIQFKDIATNLRDLASNTFEEYIKQQIKQIEDILKEAGLCNIKSVDKLEANTEKCIRQCLRQQELLKTVWQKVLPYEIYNKTVGRILDSACISITKAIVDLEDISSEAAEQLSDALKIITVRGPKLFTDPNEIPLYVEHWDRLKEIVIVLTSGLVDINERWADGKGPLGLHYKPVEIRNLIRALFQNTDKRAAILSKIRD